MSTTVAVEKSQASIRTTLVAYIAEGYKIEERRDVGGQEWALVEWGWRGQRVRFEVAVDRPDSGEVSRLTRRARTRTAAEIEEDAREALRRESWRALSRSIDARMRAVNAGVETFEEAFLAHLVTPDGEQLYEQLRNSEQGARLSLPAPAVEVVA